MVWPASVGIDYGIMGQRRSWVLLAAATAVAGESDTGVTVSAAFATGVGCWSGCWGACLPLGSLYAGCGQDFLPPDFNCL